MGPNFLITTGHKIHPTLEKGPIHAILASQKTHLALEKGTHPCNTCISNKTYVKKRNPSMQYLHIKCNLH
jgi:hypothetical protein